MGSQDLKQAIAHEIETLPEPRQADVLAFIRFIKIGLADDQTSEQRFSDALAQTETIAKERGIGAQDIENEIRAARCGT